jgi:hypothetical protein
MADRTVTLAEFLVGRVGLVKGTKVAAFIVAWGIYASKEPAPHTLEGYTRYWGQSISSTYRERDLFRICWPNEQLPDRVWASMSDVVDAKWGGDGFARDRGAARALALRGVW